MKEITQRLVDILDFVSFPVYCYYPDTDHMCQISAGEAKQVPVPSSVIKPLKQKNTHISYFKKNDKVYVFYFLRSEFEGVPTVIMVQDTIDRKRLGTFLNITEEVLNHIRMEKDRAVTRLSSLEQKAYASQTTDSLEEQERLKTKINILEKTVADYQVRMGELERKAKESSRFIENAEMTDEKLSAETSVLRRKVAEYEANLSFYHSKVQDLEHRVASRPTTTSTDDDLRTFYKNEIEKLEDRLGKLEPKLLKTELELKEAETKITEVEEERDKLVDKIEGLLAEVESAQKVIDKAEERSTILEQELEKTNDELKEHEESVMILRNSRTKLMKLLDGLVLPLISVSFDFTLINVNKAVGRFTGETDLPKHIGQPCHKSVFGLDDKCEWCKYDDVLERKELVKSSITHEKEGKELYLEHYMFPIYDRDGNFSEIGEFFEDVTEQRRVIEDFQRAKGEIKKHKRKKLEDMQEKGEMRKAYNELLENYDQVSDKNNKMAKALEKLLAEDNVNELLRLRTENKELKHKLGRAASALQNYQTSLSASSDKYNELNRKTIYQIERLINIISNKPKLKGHDIEGSLAVINSEISRIKGELDMSGNIKVEKKQPDVVKERGGPPALKRSEEDVSVEPETEGGGENNEDKDSEE